MTVRELLGTCRVAETIANAAARHDAPLRSARSDALLVTAYCWQQAGALLVAFHDRPTRSGERGVVLESAAHVEYGLSRSSSEPTNQDVRRLHAAARMLPLLAAGCMREVTNIASRAIVLGGHQPLHEGRVGEWLQGQAFVPEPPDVGPLLRTLSRARDEADRALNASSVATATLTMSMSRSRRIGERTLS